MILCSRKQENRAKLFSKSQRTSISDRFPHSRKSLSIIGNEGRRIMKNRDRQRKNRKLKHMEERIDKRNAYGAKDLTLYNTVEQLRTNGKAQIALK